MGSSAVTLKYVFQAELHLPRWAGVEEPPEVRRERDAAGRTNKVHPVGVDPVFETTS